MRPSHPGVRLACHEYGDAGLLVDVLADDPELRWAATRDLGEGFRSGDVPGVVDVVASFVNVFVQFDPLVTDHAAIEGAVVALAARPTEAARAAHVRRTGRLRRRPRSRSRVGRRGARPLAGRGRRAALRRSPWTIRFVGSPLGAPLMDGPPVPASVPRLASPRVRTEPGSVGMSGVQSIIYNAASPGGWRIVGRTPAQAVRRAHATARALPRR